MLTYAEASVMLPNRHSSRRINTVANWKRLSEYCIGLNYRGSIILKIMDNGEYIYDPGKRWLPGTIKYMNEYGPAKIRKRGQDWFLEDGRVLCSGIRVKLPEPCTDT